MNEDIIAKQQALEQENKDLQNNIKNSGINGVKGRLGSPGKTQSTV